jgi:diguanylate cyclase (GGDEF)-like protein
MPSKTKMDAQIHARLVENLFFGTRLSFISAIVVSFLFAALACLRTSDPAIYITSFVTVAISIVRVCIIASCAKRIDRSDFAQIQSFERRYAFLAVTWMFSIGTLSFFALRTDDLVLHLFVAAIVFGSMGSLAGRNSSRPYIVNLQLLAVSIPLASGFMTHGIGWHSVLVFCVLLCAIASKSATSSIYSALYRAFHSAYMGNLLASRLDTALNNMNRGLIMFDDRNCVEVVNDGFRQLFNLTETQCHAGSALDEIIESINMSCGEILSDDGGGKAFRVNVDGRGDFKMCLRLPGDKWLDIGFHPREGGGSVVVVDDITERTAQQQKIEKMARYDALTGLPNRSTFEERANEAFVRWRGNRDDFSILSADLDGFKIINDTLGHPVGDKLLIAVAERMRALLKDDDLLARFGGDEFVILQKPDDPCGDAAALAERLVRELKRPFTIDGEDGVLYENLNIGVSIGIVLASDGADVVELLKKADTAMYAAKAAGRGKYKFFRPEMEIEAKERRELEAELRRAVENGDIDVFFQPIVDIGAGRVVSCEALARWFHPRRGKIDTAKFIALAEQTGIIDELDRLVMKKACLEAAKWPNDIRVSVNVSKAQFQRNSVTEHAIQALQESSLDPGRLEIEVIETVAAEHKDAKRVLRELSSLGIRVALDDFGKGSSSLGQLSSLEFDKIKMDGSFMSDIENNERARILLKNVFRSIDEMGKTFVQEGVETAEQLAYLERIGVRQIQGYLFSQPKPAHELYEMMKHGVGAGARCVA